MITRALVLAGLFAYSAIAQYAPSASGSTTAAAEINGKVNHQEASGAPSSVNCTQGKDIYTNTANGLVYVCTASGTPGTWVAVTQAATSTTTTQALFATATAGAPAFRAIVSGDIPTLNQNTTGTAATITGLLIGGNIPKIDVLDASVFCVDAGSTDTYACNLAPAITAYVTGTHYRFKANTLNTGAASINFNSVGAKTIVKVAGGITTALATNDILAGQWVDLIYDGTNMQMQSTLGNAPSGSGTVSSGTTNVLGKYTGATTIGNSLMSDDGTTLTYTGTGGVSLTGGSVAGSLQLTQGTAPSAGTTAVTIHAPTSVTSYTMVLPGTSASGFMRGTNSSNINTISYAELSGDATTSGSGAVTVAKVNGIAYSATAAAHSVEVITSANTTATAKAIPDCTDTAGNHLNFTQSTDAFSCGTSSSGGGGSAGATLFSATASATVTATSATTLIGSVSGSTTVAANTFTAGQWMEVAAQGYYSTPATPASLTIDVLIGGTIRITTGAVVQIASVTNGVWRLRCGITTRTAGASGTQIANCIFEGTGSTLTPGDAPLQTSSTWTMDTTATKVIDIQATWSTATGSPTITSTNVAAWIPGAPVTSVFGQTGAVGNLSGDVTTTGSSVTTIANNAVTNAKILNGTIDVNAKITGLVPLANGGTGLGTAWSRSAWSSSAGCNNATAGAAWDLPTTNAPTPSCYGTSYRFGALDYADSANQTATFSFILPTGWTGAVDFAARAFVNATSQSVKLTVATICVAVSEDILNPTFNTAQTITVTSPGTANQQFEFAQAGLTTTGCAANELLILKVGRDVTDTSTATFSVMGAGVNIRITPQV